MPKPPEIHAMNLQGTTPDGLEDWLCPTCGRRFLYRWPPHYKKTVLAPGDEQAVHTGGKGVQIERTSFLEEPQAFRDWAQKNSDLLETLE